MNSIRIADHNGRNKLKYKYNIRTDLKLSKGKWAKDDGKWRYYLPIHLWKEIIDMMKFKQWTRQNIIILFQNIKPHHKTGGLYYITFY